jgi:hypothetical protein
LLSCCLSAAGVRFLGILSRPGLPPPYGRPTTPPAGGADPDRVSTFRTHETRLGSGVLYTPGATVPTRPGAVPVRRLPPRNGQPLPPRPCAPSRDAFVTRHQQGFTHVRPSSLPLTCGHQTARRPLGFPLSFTPPGTGCPDARQGGDRSPALTRATCPASAEPPSRNHSRRATSRRNCSQNWTPQRQKARPSSGPGLLTCGFSGVSDGA